MKKQATIFFCMLVLSLIFASISVFAQPKKYYIALDDHTDYVYSSSEEDYRQVFLETLDYYLNLADTTANLPSDQQSRWNCDGSFWLWTYEKNKSQAEFERLISRVRDGHIAAPMTALVSTYGAQPAEAVLRGMYYPGSLERRYGLRFQLAEAMENATLPLGVGALWSGAGVKYSWRGLCGCASRTPGGRSHPDIYWWQGLDNSRILMKWNYFYVYDGASIGSYQECRVPELAIQTAETNPDFKVNWPYNVVGLFAKGGDDIKTLTDDFVKFAVNNTNPNRQIVVSNEEDFFREFESKYGASLEPYTASHGNEWDILCASMAEVSASVKRAVEKLRSAEAIQTLVSLKNSNFMRDQIAERDLAWMNLGLFWEHDWTADGGMREERAAWQRKTANQITTYVDKLETNSKDALGAMIPNNSGNKRFYAFNSLNWTRTDFADFPYTETAPVYVVDISTGLEAPSQIVTIDGQRYLRVLASDIPPIGYKVFEIRSGAPGIFSDAASVSGNVIENAFYRLTIANNGAITSLIDKTRNKQEFVRAINGQYLNDLGASGGSFEIESAGAVSVTIKITANAPINHTTHITLFRDSDRIDIRNEINQNFSDVYSWSYNFNLDNPDTWHEEVGSILRAKTTTNGGHYSAIGSRLDWLTLNHFADMTGSNNTGITLSNADCHFMQLGFSEITALDTNTPRLAPLVGGQVDGPRLGIANQGGDSKFLQRFALRTHAAYDAAAAMRFSLEHQNPLVTNLITGGNNYPETNFSLLNISDPNVFLWSLKPAEEGIGQGIIARTYNVSNQATNATVQFANPINSAQRASHVETNIETANVTNGSLAINFTPQQYLTHRVFTTDTVDNVPPTISIIGPSNGATFAAQSSVQIATIASDTDGAIAKVEFFDGSTKIGEATSAPFDFTTESLPVGKHQITARAIDNRGKTIASSPIQMEVTSTIANATSVSAATYRRVFLARGSAAAAFGATLSSATQSAITNPLPTNLAGTSVLIKDSLGRQYSAPLFYVSPSQVNYQIPADVATGTAQISFNSSGQAPQNEFVQITRATPGLFSASADGTGLAAATITRVRADGSRSEESAVRVDQAQGKFVAVPIDLDSVTDQVFLILYGTGMRAGNLKASVNIGGVSAPIDYVGPQGFFIGVDQVNIPLPRTLAGRGDVSVNLTVQGQTANAVQIRIK